MKIEDIREIYWKDANYPDETSWLSKKDVERWRMNKEPIKNKYAKIDKMCSRCGGYADIIDEFLHIKLCNKCYSEIEGD